MFVGLLWDAAFVARERSERCVGLIVAELLVWIMGGRDTCGVASLRGVLPSRVYVNKVVV